MIHIEHLILLLGLPFRGVVEKGSVAEVNDITLSGVRKPAFSQKKFYEVNHKIHTVTNWGGLQKIYVMKGKKVNHWFYSSSELFTNKNTTHIDTPFSLHIRSSNSLFSITY